MNKLLYRTLKRVIENAKRQSQPTDGIEAKLDIFFAAEKLTEEEYQGLMAMLRPVEENPAAE